MPRGKRSLSGSAKATARRRVGIVMGSESDRAIMEEAARVLADHGVGHEIVVRSAHRTPAAAARWAKSAKRRGIEVIIAGAGGAAHLAGAMAANSMLPVLGVPLASSPLGGFDALLATVQMPPGVPVGTLGVGSWGARNAAHLALRILSLSDARLGRMLEAPAARSRSSARSK
jgi:phosphoribosylaminoimidazole carboxylase PurE protein